MSEDEAIAELSERIEQLKNKAKEARNMANTYDAVSEGLERFRAWVEGKKHEVGTK